MTVTILQDRVVRFSETDQRFFERGEEHSLIPVHEQKLVGLGVARAGGLNDDKPAAPRKALNPVTENKMTDPVTEAKDGDIKRKPKKA